MATDSEDSTSHLKGLSFIDWDSLDQDEFVKLEKIINDSKESPGVQLPFVQSTLKSLKGPAAGNNVDISASVLHPAAPVFQPAIPPPSIVRFPIPVPAWTHHRDPSVPPTSGHPPYPIPVHGGYVFQDPALAANGDVTVAFVTTLSNGQPVYAFPGHQLPPSFQPPPPAHAHANRVNGAAAAVPPHVGPHIPPPCHPPHHGGGDLVLQPVTAVQGAVITPSPPHPLVIGHGATSVGMGLPPPPPGHMGVRVAAAPLATTSPVVSMPNQPQATQVMHITQVTPIQPQPSQMGVIVSAPASEAPRQIQEHNTSVSSTAAKTISGLPPQQKAPGIEFAGPVVFDVPSTQTNSEVMTNARSLKKEDTPETNINSNVQVKKPSSKEAPISVKCDEMSGQKADHSRKISGPPSNTKQESNFAIDTFPSSSSSSLTCAKSPVPQESVNNVNSNASDTNDFPIMNSPRSPLSPSALPPKDPNSKGSFPPGTKPTTPTVTPAAAPKMWSSLFGKRDGAKLNAVSGPITQQDPSVHSTPSTTAGGSEVSVPVNDNQPKSVSYWQEQERATATAVANPNGAPEKVKSVVAKQDPLAPRLLEKLSNFPISHTPIVIQPRGLKNGKNTCFMNATLQVLMGCPPFVHLFRAFKSFPARSRGGSSTPIFDSLVLFVNSFQNGQRAKQGPRGKKANNMDISIGLPFSPDPLLSVAQDILGLNIGVQHDAEEFLSQILSICHEELENIIKMNKNLDSVNNNSDAKSLSDANGHIDSFNHVEGFDDDEEEDDSWQRVGPKNHSVETNVNDCGQTPLSSIFAGLSRSCLQRESGKSSDTLDSFFTLKLDIQAESVHSVKDALLRLNTVEIVHDADGRKVHGQRRMFFDVLPPVLIMHLKLFEYSNGNGLKIQKKITFDVDLQIPKEILSRVGRTKYSSPKSRSYKLFGVVNHHGIRMNDGHYTSDVFLPIVNGWLHFDDSQVAPNTEAQVLQYCEGSMPYMLFYRRLDALNITNKAEQSN